MRPHILTFKLVYLLDSWDGLHDGLYALHVVNVVAHACEYIGIVSDFGDAYVAEESLHL